MILTDYGDSGVGILYEIGAFAHAAPALTSALRKVHSVLTLLVLTTLAVPFVYRYAVLVWGGGGGDGTPLGRRLGGGERAGARFYAVTLTIACAAALGWSLPQIVLKPYPSEAEARHAIELLFADKNNNDSTTTTTHFDHTVSTYYTMVSLRVLRSGA